MLQLFVEHLVIKFKDMMPFANRLNLVSSFTMNRVHLYKSPFLQALRGNEPDIFSHKIIMNIKTTLDSMVSQLEKERK